MKVLKTFNQLFENKKDLDISNILCFLYENEIVVNEGLLYSLYVGEGVMDIENTGDDIEITYIDNTWGGVELSEWITLLDALKKLNTNSVGIDFDTNVSHNSLSIIKNENYDFVLYNKKYFKELYLKSITNNFNI